MRLTKEAKLSPRILQPTAGLPPTPWMFGKRNSFAI